MLGVGNIIITAEGEGLLIDWDLCINLRNQDAVARRPERTVRVPLYVSTNLLSFILRVHGNLCQSRFSLDLT
jgi:RIO-like serine/threonine protein kinase